MSHYATAPARFEEILKVLARTPFGRKLLEDFMPLLNRKRVALAAYSAPLVAQLREALPEGQPIGAAFIHDGLTGTIYFDGDAPLGVLAPFLAHEISHALNPRVWNGEVTRSSRANVDAELKAFEDQHRFTQELKDRDPDFAQFMSTYLPKARILHERLGVVDVETLYAGIGPKRVA